MRTIAFWNEADLEHLESLARGVGRETAEGVGRAVVSLRWMLDRTNEVRGTPVKYGYSWADLDWGRWEREKEVAKHELSQLV